MKGGNSKIVDQQEGKLPPQAVDLEQAVLGALLLDFDCIHTVLEILTRPVMFYKEEHRLLFAVILEFYNDNKPVDPLMVIEYLQNKGDLELVGGAYYITTIMQKVSSTANVEHHCHVVKDRFIQRELIRIGSKLQVMGYEGETNGMEMLDQAYMLIQGVELENQTNKKRDWFEILKEVGERVERLSDNKKAFSGVDTGLSEVNRLSGGWQAGNLIILAARPGMGKTAASVRHTMAALKQGNHVAVFELEMPDVDYAVRMVCDENDYFHANMLLKHGFKSQEDWQQFQLTREAMEDLPIHLETCPGMNVMDLSIKARKLKMKHDLGLIVIDYLQLMKGVPGVKYGNREQEVSDVSRFLKKLALDLKIPVIALSQLSREVEKRGDKTPMLSDLRESGSIEQDADIVAFLYRPEYYGIESSVLDKPVEGLCEYIFAKHRNGSLGSLATGFDANRIRFKDYSEIEVARTVDLAADPNDDIPF